MVHIITLITSITLIVVIKNVLGDIRLKYKKSCDIRLKFKIYFIH